MKMNYLMKGMAVMALGLVAVSCNKMDPFNPYAEQEIKQEEFTNNFQTEVLNGKSVDANQTWATTDAVVVNVTSELDGTLKIYTNNPVGEIAAPLFTQDITAGTLNVTVAKPSDVETLYAALYAADGSVKVIEVIDNAAQFLAPDKSEISVASVRANRAARRATSFPDAPDWSTVPTTVPTTAADEDTYYSTQKGDFYIKTSDSKINVWMGNANLYFAAGTYTITSLGLNANTTFYLLKGADVTFTNGFAVKYKNVKVYVAEGATFRTGTNSINCTSEIYNKGTIIAPTFTLYNAKNQWNDEGRGFLYNEGTVSCTNSYQLNDICQTVNANRMTVGVLNLAEDSHFLNKSSLTINGDLGVRNDNSSFTNEGTVTAANLNVEGSADFYNEDTGSITISGTTTVNSNMCTWHNDGYYKTQYFTYRAGSNDVINSCKLIVDEKFSIQLGAGAQSERCFKVNARGSVVTKNFEILSVSSILMGSEAIFKVTNNAVMGITTEGKVEGIYGIGDKYAIFQAKNVIKNAEGNHHYVTYGGNLYVAADQHFANGHDGGGMDNHAFYYELDNAKVIKGQNNAPIKIEKNGNCSDGYAGGTPSNNDPVMYYYYAFEDLGTTDDFDFNDVVIRVSAPVNGKSTVTLMAAGGIYPAVVTYGTGSSIRNIGEEVHAAFGVSTGKTEDMVNTGGKKKDFVTLGTIDLPSNADMSNLPIGITVTGNNGQVTRVERSVANNGKAPLVIAVSGYSSGENAGKWFWPLERTNISSAYTQFGEWGANASTHKDWYKNFTNDKVYKWQ